MRALCIWWRRVRRLRALRGGFEALGLQAQRRPARTDMSEAIAVSVGESPMALPQFLFSKTTKNVPNKQVTIGTEDIGNG